MASNFDDSSKLASHLSLLKSEYRKLQIRLVEVERQNNILKAKLSSSEITELENSFAGKILQHVALLFNNPNHSDMKIILSSEVIYGHKWIFWSRSNEWGVNLHQEDILDWKNISSKVGNALLRWIYTDFINLNDEEDDFILELMNLCHCHQLFYLQNRCEESLISSLSLHNCMQYFSTADELEAKILRAHCSDFISSHWNDFKLEDFAQLTAPLLYSMLKNKSLYPLHAAIRIHREDVIFLYLIEFNNELNKKLNMEDDKGELPLNLALCSKQQELAFTLVNHKVNLDQMTSKGETVLHLAIQREDEDSALFLISQGCGVSSITSLEGNSPLHLTAQYSSMGNVAYKLIEKGAQVNAINHDKMTPLITSINHNNINVFDILLESRGCVLEEKSNAGLPPLWYALQSKDLRFAIKLVEKKTQLNTICDSEGNTLLHLCAAQRLEESCIFLIKSGCKVNTTNNASETPLHLASSHGMNALVESLLHHGASLDTQNIPKHQTPLHVAIINNHIQVIETILSQRLSEESISFLKLKDTEENTPLGLALKAKLFDVALRLIAAGADVNSTNSSGHTLLHKSLLNKDSEASIFLLNHGADVNIKTSDEKTPIELAISNNLGSVVETLCRRGADISSNDSVSSLWLSMQINKDISSILIRHGIDVDGWFPGPDDCLQTYLHRAIDENLEDIACFLIRSGCDLNSPRKPNGNKGGDEAYDLASPLHLCCQWGLQNTVVELIKHGALLNAKNSEGKTPLHISIEEGHHAITNLLLDNCKDSSDVSICDKNGLTPFAVALNFKNTLIANKILSIDPNAAELYDSRARNFLHNAILKNNLESVLFLLSIQVNIHSRTKDVSSLSPLLLAVQLGNDMIVRNLLLAGASVNDVNIYGQSSLHIAAENNFPSIASILLSNNIKYNLSDNRGNNALHLAVKEGHLEVIRILLTESQIDAETFNLKNRNHLHILANFGLENSSSIFDLFLECMPNYPINKQDGDGNTPLFLAYNKGNGSLCRSLVLRGAVMGTFNKSGISIFNSQVASKQLLYRLLDYLSNEPKWGEGDSCEECSTKFGLTTRKHHCRHCGRLVCGKCSDNHMPILKYNLTKPVRVCNLCSDILTIGPGLAS